MGRLNAGQLNQRVALTWDGPAVSDGEGGSYPGEETSLTVWARVETLTTREVLENGQVLNGQILRVTIRPIESQPMPDRVRWKDKTLNPTGMVPDEYHEYRILNCTDAGQ